jgi:hypothetical protein
MAKDASPTAAYSAATLGASYGLAASRWPAVERSAIVNLLATQFVGESVVVHEETAAVVERVASEKGWQVARDVRVGGTPGPYRILTS